MAGTIRSRLAGHRGICSSRRRTTAGRSGMSCAHARAFSSEVDTGSREENASIEKSRAPSRFHRDGKGSRAAASHGGARRRDVLLLMAAAAAWTTSSHAQKPSMPVIGYLCPESPELFGSRLAAFHQGLREAGFVEGRNVAIEYR